MFLCAWEAPSQSSESQLLNKTYVNAGQASAPISSLRHSALVDYGVRARKSGPDYNDINGAYANASHQRTVFSANLLLITELVLMPIPATDAESGSHGMLGINH